jgi:phage repressor protein C with HTH and peptisase S24 domain
MTPVFTHEQIWSAIDQLAARHRLTPSGLARRAGLDDTSFNRSKRSLGDKKHWPSTETLAKILKATNTTLSEFASLVERTVPPPPPGEWP